MVAWSARKAGLGMELGEVLICICARYATVC